MTHDPLAPAEMQRAQQAATAERLGYGTGPEAVLALNRAHDPYHVVAARLLGLEYSPTLHWLATGEPTHPTRHEDAVGAEEDVTMALQRWMQTGEFTGPLRIVWLFGWTEDEVRAALLNATGEAP